jgi:hypothetical protein
MGGPTQSVLVVGVAVLGFLVGFATKPPPEVFYETVEVPVQVIVEREPDTVRTFVDRVVTVQSEPVQVAIAPAAVVDRVHSFCAPVVAEITRDTVYVPETELLLRSVSHRPGWFWAKDQLLLTGLTNLGDLEARDYQVRPGFTARAYGSDVLVQYPRMSLWRDVAEWAVVAGITYALVR